MALVNVDLAEVHSQIDEGWSMKDIAEFFNCDYQQLYRDYKQVYGSVTEAREISDAGLRLFLQQKVGNRPRYGYKAVRAMLHRAGIACSNDRLRSSLRAMNPSASRKRSKPIVGVRRSFVVPHNHYMWCI
eukprot:gene18663-6087_t